MKCENCKFWDDDLGNNDGICHRYPPQYTLLMCNGPESTSVEDCDQGTWPITDINDWCGEFKEKQNE